MKYDCTKLVGNVCVEWQPATETNWLDALAITQTQAAQLTTAMLVVVFSAWILRQVLNVIIGRRY